MFEIAKDTDGEGAFVTIDSVALSEMVSTSGGVSMYEYVEDHGTNCPALLRYEVRCVCGGLEGGWSAVCEVNIDNRNWAFP